MIASQAQRKKLRACDLKDMAGLEQLANEHFENFTKLLENVGRPAGPDRTIVFGSACTGSAGHHVVMTAFKNTCAQYLPHFNFEVAFDCEKEKKNASGSITSTI